MKIILPLIIAVVVLVGGYFLLGSSSAPTAHEEMTPGAKTVVADGSYSIVPEESSVAWAGKKPLIEGYINEGSMAVSSGTITVLNKTAAGSFTIDMNTLSVSKTPTKPGQEGALEGHLKGERWFNVATFPTATFQITSVTERADSETSFTYDVEGNLTMKGQTHPLSFPATIYADEAGNVHAKASTEINRTTWGITSGSASFFDNLADNVIDDMVALSFHVVAKPQQ